MRAHDDNFPAGSLRFTSATSPRRRWWQFWKFFSRRIPVTYAFEEVVYPVVAVDTTDAEQESSFVLGPNEACATRTFRVSNPFGPWSKLPQLGDPHPFCGLLIAKSVRPRVLFGNCWVVDIAYRKPFDSSDIEAWGIAR